MLSSSIWYNNPMKIDLYAPKKLYGAHVMAFSGWLVVLLYELFFPMNGKHCGTGIGMSISANRFKGIRASHCTDTFTARMTRMHNDSNILCLGERITGPGLALDIVDIWLETEFEGERHKNRINMLELE